MKFDDVLYLYLGEFSRYQKIQLILVCLPTIFTALHALSWTFSAAIIPHRCLLPDENASVPFDVSTISWANLSLPSDSKCSRFVSSSAWSDSVSDKNTQSCIDGYKWDTSEISNTAVSRWAIVCDRGYIRAVVQSTYYVGQLFGSLVCGFMGDRIGRIKVFLSAISIQIICGTLTSVAPYWPVFALLRAGLGFAHPGIFIIAVVIGMELVGPSKRKIAGVLSGICFSIGQMLLGLGAYLVRDYQYLQLVISLPALVFVSYIWLVPESARWLMSQGKIREANDVLQFASKINKTNIPNDWHEGLEKKSNRNLEKQKISLKNLVKTAAIRKRLFIVFFCWPVVSMVYYGISMNPTFLGGDRYVTFILAGFMEIPGLLFVYFTIDRLGRRWLLSGGYIIAGLCLFSTLVVPESLAYLNIIQVVITKTAITATYAVIYTFTPELFPTGIRNTIMGFCSMMARIGAVAASYVAMWLVERSRLSMVLLFGSFALIAGSLSLLLPESAGKPLPETMADIEQTNTTLELIMEEEKLEPKE